MGPHPSLPGTLGPLPPTGVGLLSPFPSPPSLFSLDPLSPPPSTFPFPLSALSGREIKPKHPLGQFQRITCFQFLINLKSRRVGRSSLSQKSETKPPKESMDSFLSPPSWGRVAVWAKSVDLAVGGTSCPECAPPGLRGPGWVQEAVAPVYPNTPPGSSGTLSLPSSPLPEMVTQVPDDKEHLLPAREHSSLPLPPAALHWGTGAVTLDV